MCDQTCISTVVEARVEDRILDKIKKCLRLSQSDNPNEAAAGLRQAQKLMAKHGVSDTDVALSDVKTTRAKGTAAFDPPNWLWALVKLISDAFGVKHLYMAKRGPQTKWKPQGYVEFIGVGDAPEIAQYAFTILQRQLKRDRTDFLKQTHPRLKRSIKTRRADLFAEGWVLAVKDKVQALVIPASEQELIDQWMARRSEESEISDAKLRSYKDINRGDARAVLSGLEAGRRVQLHQGVTGKGPAAAIGHTSHQEGA